METTKIFVTIRLTEGRKWIDTTSIGLLREITVKKAEDTEALLPQWAKSNPRIGIAEAEIVLISDPI